MHTLRCLVNEVVKIKGRSWRYLLHLINGGGGSGGGQNKWGVGISKNLLTSVMNERNINV